MRSVVLGALLSFVVCADPSYGLSNSAVPSFEGMKPQHSYISQPPAPLSRTQKLRRTAAPIVQQRLILTASIENDEAILNSKQLSKSLNIDDAPLLPWLPGRGAIGVRVKVTW